MQPHDIAAFAGMVECVEWQHEDSEELRGMTVTVIRALILLLLLGALVALSVLGGFAAYRLAKRAKWQISLRGLFGLVTAIAVMLAVFYGYRRAVMAQVQWVPPDSKQAESLFPQETVTKNARGEYEFTYYAKRTWIQALLGRLNRVDYAVDREAVRVAAEERTVANEQLQRLRDADILPAGTFVIRGSVLDRKGKPLGGATVDFLGRYVFINYCQARDDGTFTMVLNDGGRGPPAGGGYYLRIRAREETADRLVRWETGYFSLDPASRERVAWIRVPR